MIKKTFGILVTCCLFIAFSIVPLVAAEDLFELNNKIPSEGTGTVTVRGEKIPPTALTYDIKKDLAVFEGDIVLGKVSEFSQNRTDGAIITGSFYRWPNNIVPYRLKSNVSATTANNVTAAIAHIEARTTLKFVKRTSTNAAQYPDYITVQSDDYACWSNVGRTSGEQHLNVVEACGFGATVHEFCHALGMWHEQSREDRNNYVTINYANIEADKIHNFNQQITNGDDILAYDYGSLMHYGATAFTKNGLPTIETIPPGIAIGQRNGLSTTDINTLAAMYGGVAPPPPPPPPTSAVSTLPAMYKLLFGSCSVIPNGDFEGSNVSWSEYSLKDYNLIGGWGNPHSGTRYAWLGYGDNEVSRLSQDINVSSSCPYLSYYYRITSSETSCGNDYAYLFIQGIQMAQIPLCSFTEKSQWTKETIDLSSYTNQTISLQFWVVTNSTVRSDWFIDDVLFQASP